MLRNVNRADYASERLMVCPPARKALREATAIREGCCQAANPPPVFHVNNELHAMAMRERAAIRFCQRASFEIAKRAPIRLAISYDPSRAALVHHVKVFVQIPSPFLLAPRFSGYASLA